MNLSPAASKIFQTVTPIALGIGLGFTANHFRKRQKAISSQGTVDNDLDHFRKGMRNFAIFGSAGAACSVASLGVFTVGHGLFQSARLFRRIPPIDFAILMGHTRIVQLLPPRTLLLLGAITGKIGLLAFLLTEGEIFNKISFFTFGSGLGLCLGGLTIHPVLFRSALPLTLVLSGTLIGTFGLFGWLGSSDVLLRERHGK
ncbi:MAG: hypothetical protein HYW02_01355 [Deltaproteobacteria bacterium]|nr:hypothetical protein [Deltaproteobacteria bacterium]